MVLAVPDDSGMTRARAAMTGAAKSPVGDTHSSGAPKRSMSPSTLPWVASVTAGVPPMSDMIERCMRPVTVTAA